MRIICFILLFLTLYLPSKAQLADFSFTTTSGQTCSPVSIKFISNVTGTPVGYLWNFGNGGQSNEVNPSYTYTNPGTYNVILTVVFAQKVVKATKKVVVNPAFSVSLVPDRNVICKPGTITFTATGGGNVSSYNWNLGDGSPNVVTNSNGLTHNFSNFGNYSITLVATQTTGCMASSVINVSVAPPPIVTTLSQTGGCVPVAVSFGANVTVPVNGNVTNYRWDYGDGSPVSNTTTNTSSHTYGVPHVAYAPLVTITTNEGCTNSANFGRVGFGLPASVTAFPKIDTICHSDTMNVTAQSPTTNLFYWVWGDGRDTIASSPSMHHYQTLGAKTIMVQGYDNGCTGTAFPIPIFIKGVIADYTYSNTCTNESLFLFTNTSQGSPTSIFWNFGDGTVNKDSNTISHQYKSDGTYPATITVADNVSGCTESYTNTLYLATPSLVADKTEICRGENVTFNVKSNFPNPLATYTWNIDGESYGPTDTTHITIAADSVGIFHNTVYIDNGAGYCPAILNEANTLTVRGPHPQFSAPLQVCLNFPLQVTNLTQPILNGDTVKTWQWNFGATIDTNTNYQPEPYTYNKSDNYTVTLKATDQYNCAYTVSKTVFIAPVPFMLVLPHNDTICLGQTATLMAYHYDPITWSPAALVSCATCDSITVMPTTDTWFIASNSNSFGCSAQDTSIIKVYTPFNDTATFSDTAICLNDTLQLNLGPKGENVIWSPATGLSRSDILNPLAYPKQTTTYTAILYDDRGCFRDTTQLHILVNPLPIVNAGPDAKYPYNSSFLLQPTYSPNVVAYLWSPANGLSCTTCAVPQGIADYSETYTIKATSDSGCIAKDSVSIFVECMGGNLLLPTAFRPSSSSLNNVYYPFARGMKTISRFIIYNRLGQMVYQRTNFPPNDAGYGWNGKANSIDQPAGTYVYMVEAICDLGQTVSEKGTFVLIR